MIMQRRHRRHLQGGLQRLQGGLHRLQGGLHLQWLPASLDDQEAANS